MAIDPRIALGVQAPAINTPFESLGQIMALQRQQQAIQASQAQEEARRQDIAKQARAEADQQKFYSIIASSKDADEVATRLKVEAPSLYQPFLKQRADLDKAAEELKNKQLESQKIKLESDKLQNEIAVKGQEYATPFLQMVEKSGYNPDVFNFALSHIEGHGFPVDQLRARGAQGPEAIKQIVDGFKSPQQQQADIAATRQAAELPGQQATSQIQQQIAGNMQGGLTAEQRAVNAREEAARAEAARHNRAEEGLSRQRLSQEDVAVTLTPEARKLAAHQYAMTGQLPPMGMGKAGAAVRTAIINEAADEYKNLDLPSQMAAYKANQSSLVKIQQSRDAVGAFEQTALKNTDQFLETAKKVVDTGSPWLNKPLRSISGSVLGSSDQAAFNAARQAVVPEFAKLLGNPSLSGQLTDSQRHEVDTILSPDATLKQIYESLRILRSDAKNRTESLDQQIKDIQQRIATPPGGTTRTTNRVYYDASGNPVKR